MRSLRAAAAAAVMVGLAGCASVPRAGRVDTDAAAAALEQRAAALGLAGGDCLAPGWALQGRAALSNGRQGGSGRVEWVQGAGNLRLLLTAPVTRQGWELDARPGTATLEGLPGGPVSAADAVELLRQHTGWQVPLAALGCWLRAVPAGAGFGAAEVDYAPDLLPRQIRQGGWIVQYEAWATDPFTKMAMPGRIDARRGDDRVRLAIDRWGLE